MADRRRSVAVIAGGTRGIGAAIARRLAARGDALVLGYLQDRAAADALAGELRDRGVAVHTVDGNIADPATRTRIGDVVRELGGRCDALVHSVAVTSFKPLLQVKPNQWNLTFEVSARSLVDLAAALAGPLAEARGAVVAISSQGSVRHVPAYGALGPAKAALEAAVRQLAVELAPRGVRVNAIRAGLIAGAVLDHFPAGTRDVALARTPLGRLGTPDDVAGAAGFLLGPDAAWITGQVLEVDGGYAVL